MKTKILLLLLGFLLLINIVNATQIIVTPSNPYTDDNLKCSVVGASDNRAFRFEWIKNSHIVNDNNIQITRQGSIFPNDLTNENDIISCLVYGPGALIGTDTVTIRRTPPQVIPNEKPNAILNVNDDDIEINQQIRFDGSESTDSDGSIVSYSWDFGDGTFEENNNGIITHRYLREGTYNVLFRVIDNQGVSDDTGLTITVRPTQQVIIISPKSISKSSSFTGFFTHFKRTEPLYIKFTIEDRSEGIEGLGNLVDNLNVLIKDINNAETEVELHPFSGSINTGIFTSIRIDNGQECNSFIPFFCVVMNKGTYYYKLNNLPLNDDFLGQSKLWMIYGNNDNSVLLTIENNIPTADAGNDITTTINTDVRFDSGNSNDIEDDNLQYLWNFGDGSTSNLRSPTHRYTNTGIYTATLTVSDSEGASNYDTRFITVNGIIPGQNSPPIVTITSPISGFTFEINTNINFVATVTDPENDPLTYLWNFGDGSTSNLRSPTHRYTNTGNYVITLRVNDGINTVVRTVSIILINRPIINNPPIVTITSPISGNEYSIILPVTFRATVTDPENDPVTYLWNFGDGSTNNLRSPTHRYTRIGIYNATLTVTDGFNIVQNSVIINIRDIIIEPQPNTDPIARITINTENPVTNTQIEFSGLTSTDDGNIVSYSWDFGDGTTSTDSLLTHIYTTKGIYLVSLTVIDNTGRTGRTILNLDVKEFERTSNAGRRRQTAVNSVERHVFNINSILFLSNKINYKPGDLVTLLVRTSNTGNTRESLTLDVKGLNINIGRYINKIRIGTNDNSLEQVSFVIPNNINPGYYVLQASLTDTIGNSDIKYLQLLII